MSANRSVSDRQQMFCDFDIYHKGDRQLTERRREVNKGGHSGHIYELGSPDGISLGYYKINSSEQGKVIIENKQPFLQLSYTVSGKKNYTIDNGSKMLASFGRQEYNYLFLTEQQIHLNWQAGETLEIFELGVSPEEMLRFLPEEHPFFPVFNKSMEQNIPAPMSKSNLSLTPKSSNILYDMLNCPLEGRYKQLYIKGKTAELLAIQLEQYEHSQGVSKTDQVARPLKQEEKARMYHARDIILSNINSPCSLIDLAHQVGTNEAYLKSHFKQVFGTTVFGYLQVVKMAEAKELLLQGKTVSEVAYFTGYKHTAHFTRAFKKHFGFAPNKIKR